MGFSGDDEFGFFCIFSSFLSFFSFSLSLFLFPPPLIIPFWYGDAPRCSLLQKKNST